MCRRCGLGIPVEASVIETWASHITETFEYSDVHHTVELTGTCPDCQIVARANEAS
jgi:Fur family transcriptional regulator, ferric uptake regulator